MTLPEDICEVDGCGDRVAVGTIASPRDPVRDNRNFCRPHAIEYWERFGDRVTRTCQYCRRSFTTFDHIEEFCTACAKRRHKCQFCGEQFTPPKATTTVCRWCFYSGKTFEPTFAALLAEVRAMRGVREACLLHTGGGCWAFQVVRDSDGHYLLATEAFQDEAGGWTCDANLPKAEAGPWAVSAGEGYSDEGEWLGPEDEGDSLIVPADRALLLQSITAFVEVRS